MRRAIRYIDGLLHPPEIEDMARSVLRFLDREYPGVKDDDLLAALQLVKNELSSESDGN